MIFPGLVKRTFKMSTKIYIWFKYLTKMQTE